MAGKITALDLIKAHQTQKLMDAGSAVVNRNNEPYKKVDETRKAGTLIQNIADTPATALDMQKKKEDRAEGLFGTEAEQKARDARKALQEYKLTDEYKKNQKKIQQDQYVKGMLFGVRPEYEADDKEKKLQKDIDYWQGQVQQERDAKTTQRDMDAIENWSDEDKAALEQYISDKQSAFVQSLNPAATGLPADFESNPLIAKYGRQRLDQIASSYQRQQNKQKYEIAEQLGRDTTDGGFLGSILPNAQSVAANLADTLLSPLTRIAQSNVGRDDRYSTLDPYAGGQAVAYAAGVREETAKNIAGSEEGVQITDGITGREALALGYQGGMAALDTGARILASGGKYAAPAVGAGLAALGSFNQTLRQASEQGADPGQAIALATVNSGIEALTEKLPLDELFKMAKGGAKPAAKVIGNILKQAGIEILEEEASLIGTILAEAAILQEESSYNQQVMQALSNGATEEEARTQANRALLAEAINTAIVSGISGAASAAGAEYAGARFVGNPETGVQTQVQEQMSDQMQQGTQEAQSQPEQDNWMAKTYREAMGETQKTAASEETTVNVRSAKTALTEENKAKKTLAYTLASNLDSVRDMQPVSQLTGKELNDRSMKLSDQIAAFFRKLGNKVTRNGFGDVELGEYGVGGMLNHKPLNRAKALSVAAVPDVIRSGRQINYEPNWKGRSYESYTFAGPVTVNGTTVYVAAVVDKRPDNKFYLSEMVDSEGNYVRIEESPSGNSKNELPMGPEHQQGRDYAGPKELSEGSNPSANAEPTLLPKNSIPNNSKDVNGNLGSAQQADTETGVQTGASNVQQQSPEGGQVKGVGAAERNFSGVAAYEDMLTDDNVQRQRTGAVRDVEMPKKDSDGRRVTEFAGNAVSAGVTPDPMADAIKSLVGDKKLSFDTRTNKQSLENAASDINARGEDTVAREIAEHAANKAVVDGDIEKGMVLYAQYANDPKTQDEASSLFLDMAALANMSGRNLQLFSLMKRMTPEGQLMTVRKNIEKSIADINKGRSVGKQIVYVPGQKNMDAAKTVAQKRKVEIDQALEQNFLDAKTDEQRKAALDDIYKNVAVQIKPTLGEAWDAWRNLAMLGNFKTHERNFASTAAFKPYTTVKRAIGTALESVFLKQEDRTKSLVGISKEAHDLVDWAKKDAKSEDVKRLLGGTGTAGDDARSAIQDYRKILPGALDTARKKNLELMEAEDFFFKRSEYAVSLATFLKARGYNIKQVQAGQVPRGVLDAGRQYAVKEAQKATFNDRNRLSDAISKLNNVKNDGGGAVVNIIRKGIVPFLKTPANVVARVAEYNPVSLAKTLVTAKGDIDSGRKSAADVIDEISAGLTGSAAMVLGAALSEGLIPGAELIGAIEDEDEKREGAQEYSIRIGEKYYSVAWLAPAMIPLFMGANIRQKFNNMGDAVDGWDMVEALAKATGDALNPLLELSMLSSLSDIVQKVKYEETPGDMLMTGLINAATSYFTQGIPTVFGQIEQATETEKKSTYVNTDNKVERMVKTAVSGATKRLPGDLYQTTKRDEWGEPVKNPDDWTSQAFNAFFNPVTTSTRKTDEVTKEITRLNKSQPESVTPPTASKTISYTDRQGNAHKDVRLTEEQFQTLAETQGKTAKAILDTMIASKDYAALTDTQKAEAIRTAYSYARKTGEIAAIGEEHTGYGDAWMMEMEQGKEAEYIIRRVTKSELTGAMDALDTAWDKDYDQTGRSDDLKWAYDTFKAMTADARKDVEERITGTTAKYIEARDKGVSHEAFVKAAENVNKAKGTGSNGTVRDIDRRAAIANTYGLTEKQIDTIMKAYMGDYDPENGKTEKSELKYDYIRQELGLSPKAYTETYRAHLDNSKKKEKIAAIMALGYDKKTATKLYNVYAGRTDVVKWYESQ